MPVALVSSNVCLRIVRDNPLPHCYVGSMTKLNLINKHWLNIQCSKCRHDKNVPVQQFIDRGINDIEQIKAKSRCSHCSYRGEPEIVIFFRNAQDVEREKAPPEGEAGEE